jgi:plastocyanin domain-containing protein
MSMSQLLVTAAGLAAIGWVNWYFFVASRQAAVRASAARSGGGAQEVTVIVDGGYSPAIVEVRTGRPVRLSFDRRDTGSCTEEVVLPDFGIRRFLPSGQTTTVEFTPEHPGSHEFACGMGMVRGTLRVLAREGS